MHACDRAVFFHAGLEFHKHWMAPAVTVENFFARQADLDRPVEEQRGFRHDNFVIERIALAAKPAAIWRGDHANVCRRHLEHFSQGAMEIMRRLRTRPDGQLAIGIFNGHRGVLLDRKMRAALIKEGVLEDFVRFHKPLFDVSEFQGH